MATNTTWMAEGGSLWKQRFIPKVTDSDLIAEALEACMNTHFLTKTMKEWGDLRGEILAKWCEDRLEPGRAWSNTTVAYWTPPVRKSVSGLQIVALTAAGVATVCVYLLYTGKIPGGKRISVIRLPKEVTLEQ